MRVRNHEDSKPICDPGVQSPRNRGHYRWPASGVWLNWALAVLTVPVAASAVIFAVGAAMHMAVCSSAPCTDLGPNGLVYSVLLYGAPLVAALTIGVSIFTATHRRGVVIPLCGLALLLADSVVMAILFRS